MKETLKSNFSQRQYMVSEDYEIYYYSNQNAPPHLEMHTHNYYEFYFFLEGNVDITIGTQRCPLQTGDIILIPPGVSHKVTVRNMELAYRRFVFWISQEYSQELETLSPDFVYLQKWAERKQDYIFHNDAVTANAIQSRILRLLEEQKADRFGREAQIRICVNDLVLYLNRISYEQKNEAFRKSTQDLYQSVIAYIERNLEEELSLDALAQKFYVSKYHISHLFKENLGVSVHQYITKKRLAACREAIRGGESITQTCRAFGFGDYSCFYRAFKKEYGISPKDCQEGAPVSREELKK